MGDYDKYRPPPSARSSRRNADFDDDIPPRRSYDYKDDDIAIPKSTTTFNYKDDDTDEMIRSLKEKTSRRNMSDILRYEKKMFHLALSKQTVITNVKDARG